MFCLSKKEKVLETNWKYGVFHKNVSKTKFKIYLNSRIHSLQLPFPIVFSKKQTVDFKLAIPQNICLAVQSNNVRLTYFSVNTFFTLTLNIFQISI